MKKFSSDILKSFLVFLILLLPSCQSIKDGLSGRKSENSDEFLVQKKNSLVLPPDYMNLPKPKNVNNNNQTDIIEEETNIEEILQIGNEGQAIKTSEASKNIEEFVIKNIK